jgi:hypothetical protein
MVFVEEEICRALHAARVPQTVDHADCLTHDAEVRLDHAIKHAEKLVDQLKGEDAVALHVLVQMCKRVRRCQKPIRQLAEALAPQDAVHLNQETIPGVD